MTRDELVNYICTSTGYVDPDDVTACQGFVEARDRMIYDGALWRDSLVMAQIPLDPVNNADNAAGIVLLPEEFGRVVAARTTENALRVNNIEVYLRYDLDKFQEMGAPFEFSVLPALWFVYRGLVGVQFQAQSDNVTIRVVSKENNIRYTNDLNLQNLVTQPIMTQLAPQFVVSNAGDAYSNGNYTYNPNGVGANVGAWQNGQVDPGNNVRTLTTAGDGIKIYSGPAGAPLTTLLYQTAVGTNGWTAVNGAAPAPKVVYPPNTTIEFIAAYKTVTTGPITLFALFNSLIFPNANFQLNLPQFDAARTKTPAYVRLRLFGIPSTAVTLRVLGKLKYQGFSYPEQEPTIRNSENALIAFARADLLRRGGENAAAATALQEGGVLLQTLKDEEAVQESTNTRIIPDQGYGPEWGLGPYIRPYF